MCGMCGMFFLFCIYMRAREKVDKTARFSVFVHLRKKRMYLCVHPLVLDMYSPVCVYHPGFWVSEPPDFRISLWAMGNRYILLSQ